MPEYKPPHEGQMKEGHFPNTETALLELHRLLAIFLSSKSFADLRVGEDGEGHDPIYKLQEFEHDEISRILLMLAITARVIDDREDYIYDLIGGSCGRLQKDVSQALVEDLPLREACNKIMHARKLRLDVEKNDRGHVYFNPVIYLYGSQAKLEWKATLDVIAFAKEYAGCVSHF